ncbi:hypothetical protein JYT36_00640 [Bacteroidales bacterium AH-315-N07]|nr:hypothetical protein [Bacteroidales bacterium AH-315-N07]
MNILFTLLFGLLLTIPSLSYSQSKKKIKKNQVKSRTEWETSYTRGKETKYKSTFRKFDKNGNMIEDILYNPKGNIKRKETFKYDGKDNKIEEIRYNPDGTVKRKITFKYDDKGLRIGRTIYDAKDQIKSKEKRQYQYYD